MDVVPAFGDGLEVHVPTAAMGISTRGTFSDGNGTQMLISDLSCAALRNT